MRTLLLTLALCAVTTTAHAEQATHSWFSIGLAGGTGDVKYPDATQADGVNTEGGMLALTNFSVTAVGSVAIRLRYSDASVLFEDDQGDDPAEAAYLVGMPLTPDRRRGPILFLGLGRVFHPDDNLNRPINGLGAELSIFRWGGDTIGGEIGLQGMYRDRGDEEVDYIAFNVNLRLGKL